MAGVVRRDGLREKVIAEARKYAVKRATRSGPYVETVTLPDLARVLDAVPDVPPTEDVWCQCFGTPEPTGNWVYPNDEHADTCGADVPPDPPTADAPTDEVEGSDHAADRTQVDLASDPAVQRHGQVAEEAGRHGDPDAALQRRVEGHGSGRGRAARRRDDRGHPAPLAPGGTDVPPDPPAADLEAVTRVLLAHDGEVEDDGQRIRCTGVGCGFRTETVGSARTQFAAHVARVLASLPDDRLVDAAAVRARARTETLRELADFFMTRDGPGYVVEEICRRIEGDRAVSERDRRTT